MKKYFKTAKKRYYITTNVETLDFIKGLRFFFVVRLKNVPYYTLLHVVNSITQHCYTYIFVYQFV